ncbi:hypothetical protein PVK06_047576 [Gossypium arboreum]|uniref:Uncharacterized protein n=1 Tax=Gossypium arboreum TaxID=29729 RepID=A0ABR0MDP3_GOSAR|nr:hypothetical protein PVK06_047576 [Gossypium arboreum]
MIQVAFYGTIRKDLSSFMFYGDCSSSVLLNTLYVAASKLVLFEFCSRAGEEQPVEWDYSRRLFFSCSRIPFRFSEGSNTDSLVWWFGHREKAYPWDFYFLRPRQRKGPKEIGPVRSVPVLPARADPFPYAGAKEQASEQVSKPASISGLTVFAERMLVLSGQERSPHVGAKTRSGSGKLTLAEPSESDASSKAAKSLSFSDFGMKVKEREAIAVKRPEGVSQSYGFGRANELMGELLARKT